MKLLVAVTAALFVLRLYAATQVGFGDSEALYASWAMHPQPAYLDHPGLVGLVARIIGDGASPSPLRTHLVTAFVASAVPWLVYASARAFGAEASRAAAAAVVVAVVPEIAVGLFALTPDLLLAPLWLGALAAAISGLRAEPGSTRAAVFLLGAGLAAGIATSAKASGLLLFVALAVAYASVARAEVPEARGARTAWPWLGLVAGAIVVLPVFLYEAGHGWPMLRHRLVDSQHGALFANAAAAVGGQLLYVSPLLLVLAFVVARDLWRARNADAASRILFFATAIPFVPLFVLSAASPVAEPHWLAPAFLALPLHAAARMDLSARRLTMAAAVAGVLTLLAHAWVLVPASARLFPSDADPKADIASELYGWPAAIEDVRAQMSSAGTPFDPEGKEAVVVGPHWTICAQLHAALPGVRVGCATPIRDDFDGWLPRDAWRASKDVIWVTDNRFAADGAAELPGHVRSAESRVRVYRGGRVSRVFSIIVYTRTATSSY